MLDRVEIREALREFVRGPAPSVATLAGEPLSGKSAVLRELETASTRGPALRLRGSLLPAGLMAAEALAGVRRQMQELSEASGDAWQPAGAGASPASEQTDSPSDEPGPWTALFRELDSVTATAAPRLLILDDADALLADRRFLEELRHWWGRMRARSAPVHLVLAVRRTDGLAGLSDPAVSAPPLSAAVRLELGPLTLREAAARVPAWSPRACVETYALVGGFAPFWHGVDGSVRPETNLARLLLSPGAPLRRAPWSFLNAMTAIGDRPLGILHALANGAARWGDIRERAGAFRSSAELGPYMKSLQEDGLVVAHRSLDAPPTSRQTRYRLVHPIVGFWYGAVHPQLASLDGQTPARGAWKALIASARREAVVRTLPSILAQYLRLHGHERLPGRAREAGGLWGDGYDIPVAATLETGTVVYAVIEWRQQRPEAVDGLLEQIRRTRYGFGRENRVPVIVVRDPPSHEMARRVARVDGAVLLTDRELVGR